MDIKIINSVQNELALQSRITFFIFQPSKFTDRLKSEWF
jgi:hypothetical protein